MDLMELSQDLNITKLHYSENNHTSNMLYSPINTKSSRSNIFSLFSKKKNKKPSLINKTIKPTLDEAYDNNINYNFSDNTDNTLLQQPVNLESNDHKSKLIPTSYCGIFLALIILKNIYFKLQ